MIKQLTLIVLFCLSAVVSRAEDVGQFSNDWTGNGMVVEAVADAKVGGVTCHLVRFDRSVIDRLAIIRHQPVTMVTTDIDWSDRCSTLVSARELHRV